ncbi:MAG: hypothetical protein HY811_08190 [Planctomycetes bacterium]|nr:hypothetical protein [Planctomycetota bacterium]
MEKNQYKICIEVLKTLDKGAALPYLILIGSWCAYFYRDYFNTVDYLPFIKTRDIDFLVSLPIRSEGKIDIPELLSGLGFVTDFKGSKGYIKLTHPELLIEFLVPEKGKGMDKPYPIPKLGINATALRFLSFLTDNTIRVKVENFYLTLPHPANFALHKLIIFQRRTKEDKAQKDRNIALEVLRALIKKGEIKVIRSVFNSIPQKWQKKIIMGLEKAKEKELINTLQNKEK